MPVDNNPKKTALINGKEYPLVCLDQNYSLNEKITGITASISYDNANNEFDILMKLVDISPK